MIVVTIYMCSHCTRVHNAAHECVQHELEEHSEAKKSKLFKKSIDCRKLPKRSKRPRDDEDDSDLHDQSLLDDVQFFANDYTTAIESDMSDYDIAEDPHAAHSSKKPRRTRQTNEYKLDVLNEMREKGYTIQYACKKYGVANGTLCGWIKSRAVIEEACRNSPYKKTKTRAGPRVNDRPDIWRDSVVVAYLQHREAVGDPVKQDGVSAIANQVHETIAKKLGVRSTFKCNDKHLENIGRLMTNPPTPSSTSSEMVTWTFENSGALNPENTQITLPVYEYAAEIRDRVNCIRSEYREKMQVWNGDFPAPVLPYLPYHYSMAWRADEEGAPLKDKRSKENDGRLVKEESGTVTDKEKYPGEVVVEDELNVAQSWSSFGNGSGVFTMIVVTIYMCSHCTRVHNAAHECVQHELEEHSATNTTKQSENSSTSQGSKRSRRRRNEDDDVEQESDLRHVDDVQFFTNEYSSAIESDEELSDEETAEDPHAARSSKKKRIQRSRPTNEYKLDILNEMQASGYSVRFMCKKFDLSRSTLGGWIRNRADIEEACQKAPFMKAIAIGGPRINDRVDSWRDSVVVAYLQHREAVGDPVKSSLICSIGRQVHRTIAQQLGVRSILKSSDRYLILVRKLMADPPAPTPSSSSSELVTWTFENSGASILENAQITLPVYEYAAEIKARINTMRNNYMEKMQVWNGDLPAPTLPQLPFHYTMAWPFDEEGAPLRDKRTEDYDEDGRPCDKKRKKARDTVATKANNGGVQVEEVNVAQCWHDFGNLGGMT